MGGAHVFPGGRVDAADGDADETWCDGIAHAARQLDSLPPAEAVAYHVAAARELFEEAGVLLARHPDGDFVSLAGAADHERLKQDRARVHDGATTLRAVIEREAPAPRARCACPVCALGDAADRQPSVRHPLFHDPRAAAPDAGARRHRNHAQPLGPPADAIAQAERDEIVLPPPTWSTLRELEPFESVEGGARLGAAAHRDPPHAESDRAGRPPHAAAARRPAASRSGRRRPAARDALRADRSAAGAPNVRPRRIRPMKKICRVAARRSCCRSPVLLRKRSTRPSSRRSRAKRSSAPR